ncbi:MAG: 5-(carboxyamino)imidazole ribonucleotide synthase, partial [Luteolibacter sp.]
MSDSRVQWHNSVIGVIGGGQLGRMLVLAARSMNIRSVVWTGGLEAPAAEVADRVIDLPFDDMAALAEFCDAASHATIEFENIPPATLARVAERIALHPSPDAVAICQNRENEKKFLQAHGIPCAAFRVVESSASLASAMSELNGPAVLKTAAFGYDGGGQIKLRGDENADDVWREFAAPRGVLEEWVSFEKELSVMVARDADGNITAYDPAENHHRQHILDYSIVPAGVSPRIASEAVDIASKLASALKYCGIMGVEFFLKKDGCLLVNEIAPRPHNSGHHTLDACVTSQFEQQIRMIVGLPAGSPRLLTPVVMLNLLGDFWLDEATPPDWRPLFADGEACLHLYGKRKASARRRLRESRGHLRR